MLASATAAATGCPPNVMPWANESRPWANGSKTRSEAITAPIGAYDGGQALGGGDEVGLVAEALGAEPLAEPAPGADDLVGDAAGCRTRRRSRARAASSRRAARGSRRSSAPARGSRTRRSPAPRTGSARGSPRPGRRPRAGTGSCSARGTSRGTAARTGARAVGDAGHGQRAHRRAVVGELARDRPCSARVAGELVVLAAELERGLDRLRAAGGEEDAVEVAGRELGDPRGELDRLRVRVGPVREEAELLRLVGAGLRRRRRGRGRCSRRTARRARRGSALPCSS